MAKGIKNVCKHGKVDMFKFVEKYELKWTGFVQTMDDGVMLATDLFSLIVTKDVRDIKDYRSTGAIGRTRGMVPDMAVAKCNLANCWPKETVTLDDNDRDMFVKELEFVKKQNISSKEGSEARVVFSSMYKGQVFKYPVVNNMIEFAKNGIESVEYRVLDGKTSVLVMKDKIGGLGLFMGLRTNEETPLLDGMDVIGTGFHNELLYIVVPSPYTQPTYKVHSKEELRWRIEREIRVVGKTGSLNHIDVSEITDFSFLFENIDFNGDISGWDVSNALTMRGMFINSTFNGDIAGWDVSNVTDMTNMFMSSDFNGDISGWDVSNVTKRDNMFLNSAYTGPDLSSDKPVEYDLDKTWSVCMPGTSFMFLVSRRLLEGLSCSMAAKYVPDGTMQKIVDDAHSELQRYGVWNEQYFDSEEEMLDKIDDAFWKEIEDAAVKNGVRYYSDINI